VTSPNPIDLASWPRRELFEHYRLRTPCTYSLTVELDVTELVSALRDSRCKTYATQIWAIASVVNRHEEFRLTLDDRGEPATWPVVHPMFTVFNAARETFAAVWTPFDPDFASFHDRAAELLAEHSRATALFPQGEPPPDAFDISSLPWTSFTGMNLNIANAWEHYLPIITLGRYAVRDGRTYLPLALQMNHAAADGFHTGRLVQELQELVRAPDWVV
jgi:chloramphenicol O-acetyltransferase type A